MNQKVKLLLAYDGSEFGGWQKQKTGKQTVQGCLEIALSRLFNEPIKTIGASRTDTGVHALAQIAHFSSPKSVERYNLINALNSLTPSSMVIHRAWLAPDDFHALASSTGKIYKYLILNRSTGSALRRHHFTWIRPKLDLEFLNKCSQHLIGEQDFKSFQTAGTDLKHTVRHIWKAQWSQKNPHLIEFTIHGSGFLKQMVRNIVGTQLDLLAQGRKPTEIVEIIAAKDRSAALGTAPPEGLYLYKVEYPPELDKRCRKL